ncbi:MAG: NAD-dependent epimerase/dehydratase family protein [Acidobacteria bacterium]|nr:NAD-dependent epimerase/dehydratase family protein [Acidobacteriota bacterium]
MSVALITGSAGLVGSEAVDAFIARGHDVIGIDNDMRRRFFGDEASTAHRREELERRHGTRYRHLDVDVRDAGRVMAVLEEYGPAVTTGIHAAAQPSHDWAAREPFTDFAVNAVGTLNLLEACREHCPDTVFIFTSTNKVYGDLPNRLPLVEQETRWEIDPSHAFANGIDESMSIDQSTHSLFGASKVAADVMVQEYGRYFGMRTGVFRGGCLTGPHHCGTMLHGFLAYLMKCTVTGSPYRVFGYRGKQVRDNIHSADLVAAFQAFAEAPRPGEVYNLGGSRFSHCSMLEAIALCQEIAGRELSWTYEAQARVGDHVWYVSDTGKFQAHYPSWVQRYDVRALLRDIHDHNVERWQSAVAG